MDATMFVRKDLRVHVYSEALRGNVRSLRGRCREGVKYCAVVKANGYGHGIRNVVNILKDDADYFAVVSAYEALMIADLVEGKRILILEPLYAGQDPELIRYCAQRGIAWTISSMDGIRYAEEKLSGSESPLRVHVELQTGMGRCGAEAEQAKPILAYMEGNSRLQASGVFTHFATADDGDLSYASEQLNLFQGFVDGMPTGLRKSLLVHAANSPATIRMPQSHFDMVRCGISMYGYTTIEGAIPIRLQGALKLDAPIVHLLRIRKGETVSYGRLFQAKRDTLAAVLPVGYADGVRRGFTQQMSLVLNGHAVPQIGRITMNQIILDVTDVPEVSCGQRVTVVDCDPQSPCSVNAWAKAENTINYEILTRIPPYARYEII